MWYRAGAACLRSSEADSMSLVFKSLNLASTKLSLNAKAFVRWRRQGLPPMNAQNLSGCKPEFNPIAWHRIRYRVVVLYLWPISWIRITIGAFPYTKWSGGTNKQRKSQNGPLHNAASMWI